MLHFYSSIQPQFQCFSSELCLYNDAYISGSEIMHLRRLNPGRLRFPKNQHAPHEQIVKRHQYIRKERRVQSGERVELCPHDPSRVSRHIAACREKWVHIFWRVMRDFIVSEKDFSMFSYLGDDSTEYHRIPLFSDDGIISFLHTGTLLRKSLRLQNKNKKKLKLDYVPLLFEFHN